MSAVVDNDRGRELLAALQRGFELTPEAMGEFLVWVDARDCAADEMHDRLKQFVRTTVLAAAVMP